MNLRILTCLILFAPLALAAQQQFGPGSRVEVDLHMSSTPEFALWKTGTVISVDLGNGGYWIQMDTGGEPKIIPKRNPDLWIRPSAAAQPPPAAPAPAAPTAPAAPAAPAPAFDPGRVLTPPANRPAPVPAGPATPPITASVTRNGPVGLYFMTRFNQSSGSLERKVWYFSADGMAYENPSAGFSREALSATATRRGSLRMDGNQMVVQIVGSHELRGTYEIKDRGSFNWNLGLFTQVQPFGNAHNLTGTWQGGHSGSGAAASRTLQLHADGSFALTGASTIGAESDRSIISGGAHGPLSQGTWQANGYFMTLNGQGGHTRTGIAFPRDEPETPRNPDSFYFDGVIWTPLN